MRNTIRIFHIRVAVAVIVNAVFACIIASTIVIYKIALTQDHITFICVHVIVTMDRRVTIRVIPLGINAISVVVSHYRDAVLIIIDLPLLVPTRIASPITGIVV
jgi:hypothetical protein